MAIRPEHQQMSFRELLDVLHTLSREGRTGTVFIHTDSNHSVRFGLENGRIISCAFGKYRGHDAIPFIREIRSGKYSFAEGIFNNASEMPLPPTGELLGSFLGTPDTAPRPAPAPAAAAPEWFPEPAAALTEIELPTGGGAALRLRGDQLYDTVVRELAMYMGPIASMVASEHAGALRAAADTGQLSAIIREMGADLGDPQQARDFLDRILSLAGD